MNLSTILGLLVFSPFYFHSLPKWEESKPPSKKGRESQIRSDSFHIAYRDLACRSGIALVILLYVCFMVELAKKSLLLTCLDGRDGIKLDTSSVKVAIEVAIEVWINFELITDNTICN